jgi:hypothetical protein
MRTRLASLGDGSSTATVTNGVIDVQLVDVAGVTTVLAVLGTPAHFYFRPVLCDAPKYTAPRGSSVPTSRMPIPTCASPYRFTSANYVSSGGGGIFTWPHPDPLYSSYPTTLATKDTPDRVVILSSNGQTPSARVVLGPAEVLYKGKSELVTSTIIKKAYVLHDTADDQWLVVFDLTGIGSKLFNADAALYYGRLIADDLDGTVISAPIIEARSFAGSGEVAGNFTKESADELAAELDSGPLPVDVKLVSS